MPVARGPLGLFAQASRIGQPRATTLVGNVRLPRSASAIFAGARLRRGVEPRAISSPSLTGGPGARELPLRDVRDLALAVVEGAVAAESLAKELKKAPDRSKHFQEIAERLRAVVGRPSIRTALSEESQNIALAPPPPVVLSVPPQLRTAEVAEPSGEHEIVLDATDHSEQLQRIEGLVRALADVDRVNELMARMSRLEEAIGRALSRREEGERYALRTPEEAIALAARLTERLRRDPRVVVRIEP